MGKGGYEGMKALLIGLSVGSIAQIVSYVIMRAFPVTIPLFVVLLIVLTILCFKS